MSKYRRLQRKKKLRATRRVDGDWSRKKKEGKYLTLGEAEGGALCQESEILRSFIVVSVSGS